jgi:hypothetical protein
MNAVLVDRVPRLTSLLGLLGLLGLGGLFAPELWGLSALSFLSYACYFRFFRWIVKPQPEVKGATLTVWLLGFLAALVSMLFTPWMFSTVPMFGFIGFAGFLGLYDPADPGLVSPGGLESFTHPDPGRMTRINLPQRPR